MSDKLLTGIVTVLTAIVGVAALAVIVTQRAQTPQVLAAGGQSLSNLIACAVSPITGSNACGQSTSVTSVFNPL